MNPDKSVKIGLGQMLVEGAEPLRNLERAKTIVEEAAGKGCDIVLLPETLDFAWTHPSALKEALPVPGEYSDFFCDLAKAHKIYICAGLTERLKDKIYNTAILIDREGSLLHKYHKINLLEVEQPFYEVGRSLGVVETEFGLIGVNICSDNYMNGLHIGHALARMGARIILSPSSWTVDFFVNEENDPYQDKWIKPYSILASLYDMIILGTTSVGYIVGGPYEGKKSIGSSLAVSKSGVLVRGDLNEFAGALTIAEIKIPERKEKGTQIGDMLEKKGYKFS